ncbi:MAG: GspE/PulE family protein [Opitutaceae bacterium]|nr:GspE/PulE family protein [Opitutaceae bacterium]
MNTVTTPIGRIGGGLAKRAAEVSQPVSEGALAWGISIDRLLEDEWISAALKQRGVGEATLSCGKRHALSRGYRVDDNTLGKILAKLGLISASLWADLLAERIGCPRLRRKDLQLANEPLIASLTPAWCLASGVLPLGHSNAIHVAVTDPSSSLVRELTLRLEKLGVQMAGIGIATRAELEAAMREQAHVKSALADQNGRKLIDGILAEAIREGASDVHIVPTEHAVEVRYRVDGRLWPQHVFEGGRRDELIANAKIAGQLDIGRRNEPLDGANRFVCDGRSFKLRFSSMPTQFGENVVVRLLDQEATAMPFSELGLGEIDARALLEVSALPQGLVFLVGPTGCGKSTTLAAIIGQLDGSTYSIRTLENPIEYRLANAVQSEITGDLSFADGLRALLRQDPDYLLIGETRDLETAEIAIEAGLTGHTCFSTVHAADALGGITRLLDLGVSVGPLVAASHVFIAQRLVRRLCLRCARPAESLHPLLKAHLDRTGSACSVREPVGCEYCRDGYKGRVGLYEIRWMRDFEEIIQARGLASSRECRKHAHAIGLSTMFDDGLEKVCSGMTSIEEVLAQVSAPQI